MDYETLIILHLRDLGYDDIDHPLSVSEIKARYKELALKFHPDKQIFNDDTWMKKVNVAKDFLLSNLDLVNEFIYKHNPSIMREETIKAKQKEEEQRKAAEQAEKERQEKEAKRKAEEEKRRNEERRRWEEEQRKQREQEYKERLKRQEEERKRKAEEKRKFEEWYNSLTPKQRKKYNKQKKKEAYLKRHPNHQKIVRSITTLLLCSATLTIILVCYFNVYLKGFYNKGIQFYNEQNYTEAKIYFDKATGYKDAKDFSKRSQAEILILNNQKHEAGLIYGSINTNDDYLKSKELVWNDFVINETIAFSSDYAVAILNNGKLIGKSYGREYHVFTEYKNWENINYIAMSEDMIVALNDEGKVLVEGNNKITRKVKKWRNIVQIYTAGEIVFGLRADGKILHTGSQSNSVLKEITTWENVVNFDIQEFADYRYDQDGATYYYYAAAALVNGNVKYADIDNSYSAEVSSWQNVQYVSLSYGEWIGVHIVGLKDNNEVLACGTNHNNVCNVTNWKNVIQVYTLPTYTFGILKNGRVILVGSDAFSQKDVSEIYDAAYMPKIGNLIILDKNGNLQTEKTNKTLVISDWTNIKVPHNPFK